VRVTGTLATVVPSEKRAEIVPDGPAADGPDPHRADPEGSITTGRGDRPLPSGEPAGNEEEVVEPARLASVDGSPSEPTLEGLQQTSDAALVVAIGRWHESALSEVYRRHGGAVLALARRLLYRVDLAEDVVQEVFLALWRSPERYDPERGTLRSFLLAMAHGRSVDVLRADASRRGREARTARTTVTAGYDVERQVTDLAVAEQVRKAVESLGDGERQAIELAYFGGHTYREVADLLGEPEGTIKSRIRVGMRRLRSLLVERGLERSWIER
jgi:RNA polymerase sigma-70 factor (ECF subfamily)